MTGRSHSSATEGRGNGEELDGCFWAAELDGPAGWATRVGSRLPFLFFFLYFFSLFFYFLISSITFEFEFRIDSNFFLNF